MSEVIGSVVFLVGSVGFSWWVNRLIAPWPQWTVALGYIIQLIFIGGMAAVVGLTFGGSA